MLISKEERVVLYETNREPRDVEGFVMSLEDWMSEMKESVSVYSEGDEKKEKLEEEEVYGQQKV